MGMRTYIVEFEDGCTFPITAMSKGDVRGIADSRGLVAEHGRVTYID